MDPLGFALENFDVMGRWRSEESGKPIDASGELPDGTRFNGPAELKAALLERKDAFVRNLARRMLGYALGRSLNLRDSCAIDTIVADVARQDYKAQALVEAVIASEPFQSGLNSKAVATTRRMSRGRALP